MSASSKKAPPPIPHPSSLTLGAIEEAAYRGTMRAIQDANIEMTRTTIKQLHRAKGFSGSRLAQEVGCSQPTIYRIENCELKSFEQSTIEICKRIASVLGYQQEYYLRTVQLQMERRWNR